MRSDLLSRSGEVFLYVQDDKVQIKRGLVNSSRSCGIYND